MNRNITIKLSILTFFILILKGAGMTQDMNKIDLGGTWKFRRAGSEKWLNAKVPGVVHLDLMRNGVITDPFYRDNEPLQQWIGETGWEYEKTFFISDTVLLHNNVDLVCKGLDTYANVYLNDSLILVADNMFRAWYVELKYMLNNGVNKLRIQFPAITAENKR